MKEQKKIFALYSDECIRVYQAYNSAIAQEAVKLQTFGEHFRLNRMTWIKTSFLWMMYRSDWGRKEDQTSILAIDLYVDQFYELLQHAVLTSHKSSFYKTSDEWKIALNKTDVYCQWDPDKKINGENTNRAAIQLGIKGETLNKMLQNGIHHIEDITSFVQKCLIQREENIFNSVNLPVEKYFPVKNENVRQKLAMEEFSN